jgi:hypothetical protein
VTFWIQRVGLEAYQPPLGLTGKLMCRGAAKRHQSSPLGGYPRRQRSFRHAAIQAIVSNDAIRVGLVKPHQLEDEIPHFHSERIRPNPITDRRDATSASFELGTEGVIIDADLPCEVPLRSGPRQSKPLLRLPSLCAWRCAQRRGINRRWVLFLGGLDLAQPSFGGLAAFVSSMPKSETCSNHPGMV